MRRFIGLDIFREFFKTPADLLSDEGITLFIQRIRSEEGKSICESYGIDSFDLEKFVATLNDPMNVLFYGWIIKSESLNAFLQEGKLGNYSGAEIKEHKFFNDFRVFVTPYLAPRLLEIQSDDFHVINSALSYAMLIDDDHVALVESHLFKPVKEVVELELQKASSAKTEEELLTIAQTTTSNLIVRIVNALSRSSYALRLKYVDDQLTIIRMDACSPRLANWMIRQLEQIKLNNEHQHKLNEFRSELKTGAIKTKNTLVKKSPIQLGRVAMYLFILVVIGGVWWIIAYKPFSDPEPIPVVDNTSFEQFTPEERKRIDSMLKEMQGNRMPDDYLDNSAPIYGGSSAIVVRNKYPNDKLELLYDDFEKDAQLQSIHSDSCVRGLNFVPLKGTTLLSKRSATLSAMFRNDSDYDALVIVALPTKNGKIYTELLKSGETKTLNLDKGDILTVIFGRNFNSFSKPVGVDPNDLPSKDFSHHFCETDFNYENSINSAYEVVGLNNGKTKFLITGDLHMMVDFVDIYGVLEVW